VLVEAIPVGGDGRGRAVLPLEVGEPCLGDRGELGVCVISASAFGLFDGAGIVGLKAMIPTRHRPLLRAVQPHPRAEPVRGGRFLQRAPVRRADRWLVISVGGEDERGGGGTGRRPWRRGRGR
jgi:hypothetical protein